MKMEMQNQKTNINTNFLNKKMKTFNIKSSVEHFIIIIYQTNKNFRGKNSSRQCVCMKTWFDYNKREHRISTNEHEFEVVRSDRNKKETRGWKRKFKFNNDDDFSLLPLILATFFVFA